MKVIKTGRGECKSSSSDCVTLQFFISLENQQCRSPKGTGTSFCLLCAHLNQNIRAQQTVPEPCSAACCCHFQARIGSRIPRWVSQTKICGRARSLFWVIKILYLWGVAWCRAVLTLQSIVICLIYTMIPFCYSTFSLVSQDRGSRAFWLPFVSPERS